MFKSLKPFYTVLLLSLFAPIMSTAQDSRSFSELDLGSRSDDNKIINDGLNQSYKTLASFASFTEKTNHLFFLEANYQMERTFLIVVALLDHNYIYNNPNYRESNQKMYENDIVVERLVKILAKNGNPKAFPSLLNIVIHPDRHRDATVNAAYTAMTQLKW